MDKEVFLCSQMVCALIEVMGMVAENEQRKIMGNSPAYVEDSFMSLINKYGLGHNSVITYLQEE